MCSFCVFLDSRQCKNISPGSEMERGTKKKHECRLLARKVAGEGQHTTNAKKTEICRGVLDGYTFRRVMVGNFEQSSLEGSVPTFSMWCS